MVRNSRASVKCGEVSNASAKNIKGPGMQISRTNAKLMVVH